MYQAVLVRMVRITKCLETGQSLETVASLEPECTRGCVILVMLASCADAQCRVAEMYKGFMAGGP
jgi:hypothetical protein